MSLAEKIQKDLVDAMAWYAAFPATFVGVAP